MKSLWVKIGDTDNKIDTMADKTFLVFLPKIIESVTGGQLRFNTEKNVEKLGSHGKRKCKRLQTLDKLFSNFFLYLKLELIIPSACEA